MLAFIIIIGRGRGDTESNGFDQRAGRTAVIIRVGLWLLHQAGLQGELASFMDHKCARTPAVEKRKFSCKALVVISEKQIWVLAAPADQLDHGSDQV